MPNAAQTIAGYYTAAGAGTGVATPAPGDTFTVPSFSLSSKAYLENVYVSGADTDWVRIRSPRMHDPNQGLRLWTGTVLHRELLPWGLDQVLYPSDTPTIEIDQSAAASGGILVQYGFDDLAGSQPRLAGWTEVQSRIVQVSGVEVDVTSGVLGAWGASAAINSSYDNFEAGADYALLGYLSSAACLGIAISGKDTGNLKVGGPGSSDAIDTQDFFINWSERTGRPRIPVIAANNKGATMLQNVDSAAATACKVTLIMAQLA
jgi:hypothetical protein